MNESHKSDQNRHAGLLKLLLFLSFACAALIITILTPVGDYFSVGRISRLAGSLGYMGPMVILLAAVVSPVFFLPRWPVAWAAGLLYGICWGTALATVASAIGALFHYVLARGLLAPYARKVMLRFGLNGESMTDGRMFYLFFFLRAFPLSNSVATNLLGGAMKVRPLVYISATVFGMIPSTLMYASWGKMMKERSASYSMVAILSALFILLGCVVAQRTFLPWLKDLKSSQ
jgi:uncharacterized membrane protein YdjX (TVP38/TMEM64 family)